MPCPKRRRCQPDGAPTAKRQEKETIEQGLTMPWPRHRRDKPDSPPMAKRQPQRLYLVFDDYPWGYSIREMNLPPPPSPRRQTRRSSAAVEGGGAARPWRRRRLPPPVICFEAPRRCPLYFAAVGTRIVATHRRDLFGDQSVPADFLPIVDVRWRGQVYHHSPIYLPVEDELLALDTCNFMKLSFKPLWPPRLESCDTSTAEWSWCELPRQQFDRIDVTSYAIAGQNILFSTEAEGEPTLHPDGKTVLRSTETYPATFAFDTVELVWKRFGNWMLPFTGRAFFVSSLQAFVGLSKDPGNFGHLCCCKVEAATDDPPAWKLGKEKLFSEDPAESHVGATLINIGWNVFCLVQCVSIEDGNIADQKLQEGQLEKGGEVSRRCCYLYRLTTFSLSYDDNGDLTTGGTCQVRCYKVPEETSEKFLHKNPVAFWM